MTAINRKAFPLAALLLCAVIAPEGAGAADAVSVPDFSGVWQVLPPYSTGDRNLRALDGQPIPLAPAAAAELKYLQDREATSKPVIHNTQLGWPKAFIQASRGRFNFEIVQEKKQISFFFEEDHQYFMAYMDAEHPKNVKPSFLGDSVSHWEGDTLVIDTVGMNGETPLNNFQVSNKLHVTMSMRLINDGNQLENIVTIDDPGAFTRTWQLKLVYGRRKDERLSESVYAENNRDLPDFDNQ
jgi:hypothetical protein